MMNWFTKTCKERTTQNKRQNETRAKKIIHHIFGDPNYLISTEEEMNMIINKAKEVYAPSTIGRLVNWINKNSTVKQFDISFVIKNLKRNNKRERNFLSREDYSKMFNVVYSMIKNCNNINDKYAHSFYCVFLLCSIFGLRNSDASNFSMDDLKMLISNNRIIITIEKTQNPLEIVVKSKKVKDILCDIVKSMEMNGPILKNKLFDYFEKLYTTTLNKPKPKNLSFGCLRFRFSTIDTILKDDEKYECDNNSLAVTSNENNEEFNFDKTKEFTTSNDEAFLETKRKQMGHTTVRMTKHYQNVQLRNEIKSQRATNNQIADVTSVYDYTNE